MARTRSAHKMSTDEVTGKKRKRVKNTVGNVVDCDSTNSQVLPYCIPKSMWFTGKITTCSVDGVITEVVNILTLEQKELFRKTSFGHFLDCEEITFQPQLVHNALLRKVRHPNNDEAWFLLNGRYLRFSIVEFALITGLLCEGDDSFSRFQSKYSPLKETYFKEFETITNEEVDFVFHKLNDSLSHIPDTDRVRIVILYFLCCFLFETTYKKIVDHGIFVLLDNWEEMNKFPWGKLLYESTLKSMKGVLEKRRKHNRMKGFLIGLQVFFYEFLTVGEGTYWERVSVGAPFIKNWKAHLKPSAEQISKEFFNNPNAVVKGLDSKDIDMTASFMTGLRYVAPVQPGNQADLSPCNATTSDKGKKPMRVFSSHAPTEASDDDFEETPPVHLKVTPPQQYKV